MAKRQSFANPGMLRVLLPHRIGSALDNIDTIIVALTLVLLFVAFVVEWRSPAVSAGTALALLILTGVVPTAAVLDVLSSPAPVTIAGMFVISAALVRTGAIDRVSSLAIAATAQRPQLAIAIFITLAAALSAFMNNTPLVMLMIPVAAAVSHQAGESPAKLLIPLSFASILGGTCTLLGTSTNLLVDGVAQSLGLRPFTLLEVAPLGICIAITGIALLLLLRHRLPDRRLAVAPNANGDDADRESEAVQQYLVEMLVEPHSSLIAEPVAALNSLTSDNGRLLDVLRGDLSLRREFSKIRFRAGDVLVLQVPATQVAFFADETSQSSEHLAMISARATAQTQVLVSPRSEVLGLPLRRLRLRRRYGIYPLALTRRGLRIVQRLESTRLAVGDTILIEGNPEHTARFVLDASLVDVSAPVSREYRHHKAPLAIAILVAVVVLAAVGYLPIAGLAMAGAGLVLATHCIDLEDAVDAVDWPMLALICSMLAIGAAMQQVGLVDSFVNTLTPLLLEQPPWLALVVVYFLCSLLTELVTNNAVAVIVVPVAVGLAQAIGCDPRPFVVAVMIAASASFLTPIGYQTNTLVYSAGGYRFLDFTRIGVFLNLSTAAVSLVLIPRIWPL